MHKLSRRLNSTAVASALAALVTLATTNARAQNIIKNPGNHSKYAVELEPHGLLDWDGYYWGGTGFGLGMHAVIPFLDNGPVSTINNNMGIGFGINWSHFNENSCFFNGRGVVVVNGIACDANENVLRFPVFVQWNFFFTRVVSVLAEAGFGIDHSWFSWNANVCAAGAYCGDNHTGVFPYFEGGGRFIFGDTAGILVRIGYPYFTVGADFLL